MVACAANEADLASARCARRADGANGRRRLGWIACWVLDSRGDASFERYESEKQGILDSLRRRADRVVAALNKLEGVTCNQSQGALYAFPQIQLPPRAVAAADAAGKPADAFYCLALLEATGGVGVSLAEMLGVEHES